MQKKSQKEMITQLSEGNLRNTQLLIEVNGKELKGCACCICDPNKRGAGSTTATIAGKKLTSDMMVVVGSVATGS